MILTTTIAVRAVKAGGKWASARALGNDGVVETLDVGGHRAGSSGTGERSEDGSLEGSHDGQFNLTPLVERIL